MCLLQLQLPLPLQPRYAIVVGNSCDRMWLRIEPFTGDGGRDID